VTNHEPFEARLTRYLDEMHDAVEGVIKLFQQRSPGGFDPDSLADAIVEVCSDEMQALYLARDERDRLRAENADLRATIAATRLAAGGTR
jgi:hypothetical protein